MKKMYAIILAAGKGTRMPSPRPKALQTLLGETMISHVYRAISNMHEKPEIWTVIGHGAQEVRLHIEATLGAEGADRCVLQEKQLGTGHAALCALNAMKEKKVSSSMKNNGKVLITNADTPLITTEILQDFVEKAQNTPLAFMSLKLDEPAAYGRVLRENFIENVRNLIKESCQNQVNLNRADLILANSGFANGIVEAKDFKVEFLNQFEDMCVSLKDQVEIFEVNSGIYLIDFDLMNELLPKISTANASGEYYITDLIGLAKEQGYTVDAISVDSGDIAEHIPTEKCLEKCLRKCHALLGVNTPLELSSAEKQMQMKEIERRLKDGVVIHASEMVRISPCVEIEAGVEIFGPCEIYGKSFIGKNTRIESHSFVENTHIGEDCLVRSFCHFADARIADRVQIGPYARLRPLADLSNDVHIGNFVEIKKSSVGEKSKINHLSYIGDSEIGSNVNVGAGCITCNYDGKNKHKTIIKDKAFIGSNASLVAPVTIGNNSVIGAGSTITHDIPDESLAIARTREKILQKR